VASPADAMRAGKGKTGEAPPAYETFAAEHNFPGRENSIRGTFCKGHDFGDYGKLELSRRFERARLLACPERSRRVPLNPAK
jgi:hypothetical protein